MSTQNVHLDVCSSFIHNCQNVEAIKMPFGRWIDKETVVHSDDGILLNTKKEMSYQTMRRHGENLNACY